MNSMILYIAISAFFIYFVIKVVTSKRVENVKCAFAGAYDGSDTVISVPKDRNKTIYTEGETVVDLSGYEKFHISGRSLEKVGLPDGAFVYTLPLGDEDIYSICNRFVIFRYDNKRLAKEHPEITNPVDGYKARKAVTILDCKMKEEDFKEKMSNILSSDPDIEEVDSCVEHLWKKYSFASGYYKDEKKLIVSITYKKGECKDYSFHSLKFLHGVVKYKSA